MPTNKLTHRLVDNCKAAANPFKLFDGEGMYLLVDAKGGKYWRLKYRFDGKENALALGVYPQVSLALAREKRAAARSLLAQGVNPAIHREAQRDARRDSAANSFEVVAREWFKKNEPRWAKSHSAKVISRLENYVFPWLGKKPIADVSASDLLTRLRKPESEGHIETAHRLKNVCHSVMAYAIATNRLQLGQNPVAHLTDALQPVAEKHHASIVDQKGIGALLRAIDGYDGSPVTKIALKLAPLLFVRPGELRGLQWSEVDLPKAEIRIAAHRMKGRVAHLVPLASQAISLLTELHLLTGNGENAFPGIRDRKRPMSENTVNAALRRMGYPKDQMTGHGFRSMATTCLREAKWPKDAVERQMAHKERNAVIAAYDFSQHLDERRLMMQAWADMLDQMRSGAEVISLQAVGI